jgi:hypothetical protein
MTRGQLCTNHPSRAMTGFASVSMSFPSSAKHKFTMEEDERLFAAVLHHNGSNWQAIADEMGTRNSRQCRERWKNYLCPDVCRSPWTPADDKLLCEKHKEYGSQWCLIAKFFPGRTDVNVKNRWVVMTSRSAQEKQAKEKLIVSQETTSCNDFGFGAQSWLDMDLIASFGF